LNADFEFMENTSAIRQKREFIKNGLVCAGAAALSFNGRWPLMAGSLTKKDKSMETLDKPGRYSREGRFQVQTPKGVRCMICPNECSIPEGASGTCGNRKNFSGKLYSIAYGNPCSVHIDPVEKKPLLHFYPQSLAFSIATAGCNLACLNCQNWTISQTTPDKTRNEDLMPDMVVENALAAQCKSIAYTYSEPVSFYEYTCDTAKLARSKGIKNILVSAGYIHEQPLREMASFIDGANINLKSFSDAIYTKLNGGRLEPVLNTLKVLKEMNVWLEVTNLVIPGWTDDMEMIKKMCQWLHANGFDNVPLHFNRFHPEYRLTQVPATPVETLFRARSLALEAGLHFVYVGNIANTDAENTTCPTCHKTVIIRKGFRTLQNDIVSGKCRHCGNVIPGRWS
jgi:pyruvate formate lyase activating enzyme